MGDPNEDILRAIVGARNPALDVLMVFLGVAGLLYFALLWFFPLWFKGRRRDAVDLVFLLAADALLVFLLKNAFAVPRPAGPWLTPLAVPLDSVSDYAFPSGHTTRAFAAAVFLTIRMGSARWGVLLFAYASVMGFSRLYVGAHWPTDVIGGAALGLLWGFLFERFTRWSAFGRARDRLLARFRRASP